MSEGTSTQTHKLLHKSGFHFEVGDVVDGLTILGWTLGDHKGSAGLVHTNRGSFYPKIVNAHIERRMK